MNIRPKPDDYTPEANEIRISCPKCGSAYIATFEPADIARAKDFPGFTCAAGDCGYVGSAVRQES